MFFFLFLCSNGKKVEIAIKELVLGFQDLSVTSLRELLVEIKFLRFFIFIFYNIKF